VSQQADPTDLELQRARELCGLHRYTDATAALDRVLASDPENSDAWCLRSLAALGLEDADAALDAAKHALALTPEAAWPHRLASVALARQGMHEEAEWHAREAVRLDPHGWRSHVQLARALTQARRHLVDARAAADRALELAPHEVEAHMAAGAVASVQGRGADAEASFRQALAIDPQHAGAHNDLARLKLGGTLKKPTALAQAATGFATAVQANPRGEVSRRNLELVIRSFLSRVGYLIYLDGLIVVWVTKATDPLDERLIPVALLVVPAGYALRFMTQISPALRRHVRYLVTRNLRIGAAVAIELLAVAALVAGSLDGHSSRQGLAVAAAIAAFLTRIVLVVRRPKRG
jgi:Flp pilus assembly protein TadD